MPLPPPRVPDETSMPRTEEPLPSGPWNSSYEPVMLEEAEPEEHGVTSSMDEDPDTEPLSTHGSEDPDTEPLTLETMLSEILSEEEVFSEME